MRNKGLVFLLIFGVLLTSTIGAKAVDLRLGAQAQFLPDFSELTDDGADLGSLFTELDNYTFGTDLRLKLFMAELGLGATFGQYVDGSDTYTEISTLTTAGLAFDLLFMRLGIGMGPRFRVFVGDGGAYVLDDADTIQPWDNFGDAFLKSPVAVKANVDFRLGKISLGVSYTVDTVYTFEKYDEVKDLFSAEWEKGRFGVGVYYSFF